MISCHYIDHAKKIKIFLCVDQNPVSLESLFSFETKHETEIVERGRQWIESLFYLNSFSNENEYIILLAFTGSFELFLGLMTHSLFKVMYRNFDEWHFFSFFMLKLYFTRRKGLKYVFHHVGVNSPTFM